jgi:hypothetical protein
MSMRVKITIGSIAVAALVFGVFTVVSIVHELKGLDASKEDPQKLFMFYVKKEIPASVSVQNATGHAYPMGGTGITFRFKIGQKDLDDLIVSKRLNKEDSVQDGLLTALDLAELKHPEYYATDRDTTWSSSQSSVRMAVDRESGIVLYMVFSS